MSGDQSIEVSVTDTGPAVDEEVLGLLFEPFYTTKAGGTGLGLSLSRSFIEDAGGRLEAQLNPEGGMTFRFALPVDGAV